MEIGESVDDMLSEIKRLYMVLRSAGVLDNDDEEGVTWCGASSAGVKPYTGGWKTSIYLKEPLLPTSVAGMCLGGETPAALTLRDRLVKRDPTLVNFMRDALKNGSCSVCLRELVFEVDPDCRVIVSVSKHMLKVACSSDCYEKLVLRIDPCLVFWYQPHQWSTQSAQSTQSTQSAQSTQKSSPSTSPDTTPPQSRVNPRSVGAPKRQRTGAVALDETQHVRRRLFPRDD